MPTAEEVIKKFNQEAPFNFKEFLESLKQQKVQLSAPIIYQKGDGNSLVNVIFVLQDNSSILLKLSPNEVKSMLIIPTYDLALEFPGIETMQVMSYAITEPTKAPLKTSSPEQRINQLNMNQPGMGPMGSMGAMGGMGGMGPMGGMGGMGPMGGMGGMGPMGSMGPMGGMGQMGQWQQPNMGQMGQWQQPNMGQPGMMPQKNYQQMGMQQPGLVPTSAVPYPYNQYQPGAYNPPPMGTEIKQRRKR